MRASTMGVMPVASLHGLLFLSLQSVKMHLVDGLFFGGQLPRLLRERRFLGGPLKALSSSRWIHLMYPTTLAALFSRPIHPSSVRRMRMVYPVQCSLFFV